MVHNYTWRDMLCKFVCTTLHGLLFWNAVRTSIVRAIFLAICSISNLIVHAYNLVQGPGARDRARTNKICRRSIDGKRLRLLRVRRPFGIPCHTESPARRAPRSAGNIHPFLRRLLVALCVQRGSGGQGTGAQSYQFCGPLQIVGFTIQIPSYDACRVTNKNTYRYRSQPAIGPRPSISLSRSET